jgi:ferritin-like protein
MITGVIAAETGAIDFYNEIIEAAEESDPVTNDMVIAILRNEEGHRRLLRASCATMRMPKRPSGRPDGA